MIRKYLGNKKRLLASRKPVVIQAAKNLSVQKLLKALEKEFDISIDETGKGQLLTP